MIPGLAPPSPAGLFLCAAGFDAIDGMLIDMLAAIARTDYEHSSRVYQAGSRAVIHVAAHPQAPPPPACLALVVVGPIACFGASFIMDRRDAALLRVHERNIDKYQRLLKTKLSEAEVHYLQKRLSEERLSVAMLQFKEHPDRP